MTQFELYGTVDAVFCCLDSLNYLPSAKDLQDSHSPQGSMDAAGLAQFMVFAKMRAALVLPTPLGPQNRYA